MPSRPILLYGPTASGKSALALELAGRLGGAVVNADSQQVYREWRVLTARPPAGDEARVPHFLYGHVPLAESYSVGRWLREIETTLSACRADGLRPILTGGTGLYFDALTRGLAPVPRVPVELRARGEAELARLGVSEFARRLAARDPETAERIDTANPARLLRAWEVLEATGTPLARWRARGGPPLLPLSEADAFVLTPPRQTLYARCDSRLDAMIAGGALAEVEAVTALGLPGSHPGMKVVGARELARHLAGEATLEEAVTAARTATRRYAKRQLTWARGRMSAWSEVAAADPRKALETVMGVAGR